MNSYEIEHCKPQLVRSVLYAFGDTQSIVMAPSGEYYCVDASAETMSMLLDLCDGTRTVAELVSTMSNPTGFIEVVHTLLEARCLSCDTLSSNEVDRVRFDSDSAPRGESQQPQLLLLGDNFFTSLVREHNLFQGREITVINTSETMQLLDTLEQDKNNPIIIISLCTKFDREWLTWLDLFCEEHLVAWTQLHIDQGKGWCGPTIIPGHTANYHDLLARRSSAFENEALFQSLTATPYKTDNYVPPLSELLWILAFFCADVERWLSNLPSRMLSTEVEVDPVTFTLTSHPILPLPNRTLSQPFVISGQNDHNLLIDDRTGIILRYIKHDHHPSIPRQLTTIQADIANMRHIHDFTCTNDLIAGGSTFGDVDAAQTSATGEAIERYCGNYVGTLPMVHASYDDLVQSGDYAVDPCQLVLYSERQYALTNFPFVPFTRDLKVYWVQGRSLTHNRLAWLPASLVYINWHTDIFVNEPQINYTHFPGIQAGPNLEFAIASAIEEIVERDSTMIWWMNRQPLPTLHLPPEIPALWAGQPTTLGQRIWAIYLENEFDIPVVAGVVRNTTKQYINIGFAARPDPVQAVLKALTEALTLQEGSRDLNEIEERSSLRHVLRLQGASEQALKPWRADRAYLDQYRHDFRDVDSLMSQQQVCLDPRTWEHIHSWVDVPVTRSIDTLPCLPDRSMSTYQACIEQRGFEIYYADITTPDVAHSGIKVVRVIIPGLAPNFPAAFPTLGRRRIQDTPIQLSWRSIALSEEELNYFPLPHA
jgi:ribosomal protein S12 methylthiotransferase accessory factor